jgi:hypothetical protein
VRNCDECDGDGYICDETTDGSTYYPTCEDCDGIGTVFGHVACGWAFDAGMREAERDADLAFYEERDTRHARDLAAAITAERARIAGGIVDAIHAHDEFDGFGSLTDALLRVVEGK